MKKILTLMLAAVLVLSSITPVLAENKYQDDGGTLKDTENGKTFSFDKYFITQQGAIVPTVEFTFEVAEGNAIPATAPTPATAEKWTFNGGDYPTENDAKDALNLWNTNNPSDPKTDADITHVPAQAAKPGTFEIMKPISSGTGKNVSAEPTWTKQKASFSSASTVSHDPTTAGDAVHLDAREQYSKDVLTLNFTSVVFYEPGVYRYVITETNPADPALSGLLYDTQTSAAYNGGTSLPSPSVPVEGSCTRYLDVYVVDDGNGNLSISEYVMHENIDAPVTSANYGTGDVAFAGDALGDKSAGFVNEYQTVDLAVKKEVSGNQASRDKYFKITVKVPDAVATQQYVVSFANDNDSDTHDGNCDSAAGTNAATKQSYVGQLNYTTAATTASPYYTVAGSELVSGRAFYLQHGQHIVIRGLPANATYTVTEDAEDYKSEEAEVDHFKNAVSGKLNENDVKSDDDGSTAVTADGLVSTSFKNTRAGFVPTGVMMSVAGGAALIALAGAGIFFLNRKKDEEED